MLSLMTMTNPEAPIPPGEGDNKILSRREIIELSVAGGITFLITLIGIAISRTPFAREWGAYNKFLDEQQEAVDIMAKNRKFTSLGKIVEEISQNAKAYSGFFRTIQMDIELGALVFDGEDSGYLLVWDGHPYNKDKPNYTVYEFEGYDEPTPSNHTLKKILEVIQMSIDSGNQINIDIRGL